MRPFAFPLFLAALVFVGLARADEPVVFRSDVSLVRVDAQVVDRDNRAITGLAPRDFVLYEGGRPQKIQSVDSENLPVDLLLLLDVSASMRPHIERIASAAHEAMRQLSDRDRVAIMVFDRQTRVRMGFRNSQSSVDRELERLLDDETFRGGTDITRGLLDAVDYVRREGRREARKAIVIVTDDQTERDRDVEGVSRALTRADTVLCALLAPDAQRGRGAGRNSGGNPGDGGGPLGGPLGGIIFGSPRGRGGYPGGGSTGSRTKSAGATEIARESGGDTMRVDDAYALQDTLARIRQRYALHFYLPPGVRAGEEREIDVELADAVRSRYPGAEVHYRRAYFAPANVPAGAPGSTEPVVVTRSGDAPPSDDPDRPRLRRPGVSQVPDRSRQGPLDADSSSNPQPAPAAQPAPSPAPAPDPNAPGWRKARPDELPHQPPQP